MDGSFEDPMLRDLQAELSAPFPVDRIHWRIGQTNQRRVAKETGNQNARPTKGCALAYIDARDVYERLDTVCGVGGWQCKHHDAGDARLTCSIGILIEREWVWKSDGAGARQASGGLSEWDANKGDFSDALKRAAVAWGVGRYLYDLTAPWVDLDDYGKIAKSAEADLRKILTAASGDIGMQTPSERSAVAVICQTIRTFCTNRAECEEFYRSNQGMIARLSKAQRDEINAVLSAISNPVEMEQAS
jgi:hypothetical protein